MRSRIPEFDRQAESFDARAGLGPEAGAEIARAIMQLAGHGPDDLVLEIGAGTGELGQHLARQAARYLGLDLSRPLLSVFSSKLLAVPLAVADCEQPWPLPDGSVRAIVASRVAHRLRPEPVTGEAMRVLRPGGMLLIGQIQRDPASLMEQLRAERRRIASGGRGGGQERRREARSLIESLVAAGASELSPSVAARWERRRSPREIISGWEGLERGSGAGERRGGTGGRSGRRRQEFVELDDEQRTSVLRALRAWAEAAFGDLDRPVTIAEWYELRGVVLPGQQRA